jgi:hypothetical protein
MATIAIFSLPAFGSAGFFFTAERLIARTRPYGNKVRWQLVGELRNACQKQVALRNMSGIPLC